MLISTRKKHLSASLSLALGVSATALLAGCGGGSDTKTDPSGIDPTQPVSDWQLVWSDEFDGDAIDTSKWNHEVNCDGGGNQEQQCYTDNPENSYLQDGKLNIVALPAEEGADLPFTSARMTTQYKGDFTYGRIEMSAKLPSGQGSWPAFWMMPTDSEYGGWPRSGEIDIVESVNLKAAREDGTAESHIYGTLHYGKAWPDNDRSGREYMLASGENPADDFHTYAVEWQQGEIRWYMDNYLYATQRKSEVRYNSKEQAVGLAHQGWYTEYYDQESGELMTYWDNAPYDKDFFLILNFAVGGDWPANVNEGGINAEAFGPDNKFEIDYVRVYQCQADVETGKGCETVRPGYDQKVDPETPINALVEGAAPIPVPPSAGVAKNLSIFDGSFNPNWPAWDCCGGSTPEIKDGAVEFVIGASPTVVGFISRDEFITDPEGKGTPFDASPLLELNGTLSFDMEVISLPSDASAPWVVKVESNNADTAFEFAISDSLEGEVPVQGQMQTYTYDLNFLADNGLDVSAIDVIMIFPAWGTGEGAVFQVSNMEISGDVGGAPEVVVFADDENASWPMWDCCGGSTPTVEMDDDAHGNVAEFSIGADPTVMGFISREGNTDTPSPFDASAILSNGVIQFDMKVTAMPGDAPWMFKVESVGASTAVEVGLETSVEGLVPAADQWQTYTFNMSDLADAGLDVSAIDVLMIFPAWGAGEGAVYRVDNVKMYDPTAVNGDVLFADAPAAGWAIWDCCGGTTPTLEADDTAHGMTAEFVIGESPTVMGILADDDVFVDASSMLATGVVQFEMKVVNAPNDAAAPWLFKIESDGASTFAELPLTDSVEGLAPVAGEWQTYTFTLQQLSDAGLDVSYIDVLMVFPAWGQGNGAVYRLDNIVIKD